MIYLEPNISRLQMKIEHANCENFLHLYVHGSNDQSLDLALQKIDHFVQGYRAEVVIIRYVSNE